MRINNTPEDDIPVANEMQRKIFQLGFDHAYYEMYDSVKEYIQDLGPDNFCDIYEGWQWNNIILDIMERTLTWKREQL